MSLVVNIDISGSEPGHRVKGMSIKSHLAFEESSQQFLDISEKSNISVIGPGSEMELKQGPRNSNPGPGVGEPLKKGGYRVQGCSSLELIDNSSPGFVIHSGGA